jgi:phosphoglycerate dehydrogenase-like enzyme
VDQSTRFVLVGISPPVRTIVVGEENLHRLTRAHPGVRVEIVDTVERFAALLPEADGVVVLPGEFPLSPAVLRPDGRLGWVQSITVGVDKLLTPELLAAEHVVVTSSKGPVAPMMAEHAVLLMLALARDLPGFLQDRAERRWRFGRDERPMAQLFGKTILILGVGEVGGRLARICQVGFGMRVLGLSRTRRDNPHVDRYIERTELHTALGEADVVALCLALTPSTERIIDADALAAMKPTALLINVARGKLVDEAALIAALQAGRLGGAGLDATAVEPPPPESPLWTLPQVILTPHVSPARDRWRGQIADFWCENIRRFAEGEPLLGVVDRHAGY